jgi:hypothetical protein
MSAALEIYLLQDVLLEFSGESSPGVALTLTGGSVHWTFKRKITDADADALLKTTVTSHITATTSRLAIPAATVTAWGVGAFVYDVWFEDSAGKLTPGGVQKGKVVKPVPVSL